jgi:hypothetical protein
MTVYGFSDNLASPVPICMPVMDNPKDGRFLSGLPERRSSARSRDQIGSLEING